MMTVRLRLGWIVARWALFERNRPLQTESRLRLRCVWADCDINCHMNNSRYLALMDLGRYHYSLVTGLARVFLRRKWFPVLARAEIDFKRPIKPGERIVLETVPLRVGEKSATLSQRFWVGEELAADALATVVFLHRGKSQEIAGLLEDLPHLRPADPVEA